MVTDVAVLVTVAVELDKAGDLGDCAGDNTCWTSTLGVVVVVGVLFSVVSKVVVACLLVDPSAS